jgi:hypothetical protein
MQEFLGIDTKQGCQRANREVVAFLLAAATADDVAQRSNEDDELSVGISSYLLHNRS